ncbi:MAG: bifunctional phosphopantothenoylcysteine decarboxylase/phosphopantothenate--cysteine ligase CoaBC [Chloroflexi bacterium]|nr:bifunctional phosphopantothenoylcysteine decarboxylase/phosphopantothenate--cysteine ligase CoaBC [Chloroflexota bacterium]MCI0818302.1 bifunctional phosphopantothenoylcysteine decarboxylase/phosphopantothenate--cysteine ligase CoaBC [Chloroflexota bacterium]MCI0819504.1 bifunctional phosphopantothenoylcysteine decarboxylase/phosphopantothenate--cysteine ligase CoaBC [Chloroflexota bacterium]MCI0831749.1 bifunctional phosphopantothenoylcysteine decarboxylase/phosphopantothenate--cysteine liga
MYNLTDKQIVLGVTGSIAAYKAPDLASKLTQAGAAVDVAMTESATRFVAPITFQSVTGRRAYHDMWDEASEIAELHVVLGRRADLMVIAPATATMLARMAHGLAEDLVSLTALATQAPVLVAPAMDPHMWEHAATQANVDTLRSRGVSFVGPEEGRLASGQMGTGRMSEVPILLGAVRTALGRGGNLTGKKIVVSAGGTREAIDPVRFIGNESSGKMGFAVAEAARDRGADVVLVSGEAALPDPYGVDVQRVRSATQMRDAILAACDGAHALIMAAAVADFQPAEPVGEKIKRKGRESLSLHLAPTPDILAEVGRPRGLVKVGFAAESQDLVANAKAKIESKGLDLIVANDITATDAGFSVDTNRVLVIDGKGEQEEWPLMSKYEVAWRILDKVQRLFEA